MDSSLEGRIDRAVARSLDDGQMSGCVVLIGRREGIVFEKAYGNRCVEPQKEPMTTDTLFDMASLTKPVATATSVMILIERGQLRLQDKVAKFFPEFAANGKEDVTVEQLLVHSSGLTARQSACRLFRRLEFGEAEDLRFGTADPSRAPNSSTRT